MPTIRLAWVSLASVFLVNVACVGCGGAAPVRDPVVPVAPAGTSGTAAPPGPPPATDATHDAWKLPEGPREPKPNSPAPGAVHDELRLDRWMKASKVKGVAATPAPCAAFVKRVASAPPPKDVSTALAERDPAKRDAMLMALEKTESAPGAIRVLRAELAPVECGDVIADPFLSTRAGVAGYAGHVLVGLSLAAKLARTAASAPPMRDASDKEKVKRFIQGPLRTWMVEQATAIEVLSDPATELMWPGRAVAAVEAGMADLRLVDRIRSSPVPSTWDKELKAVYEAALDDALEPRKRRGRDAALVGLADFAADGVLLDPRVDRARALLAKLYGGRRIDALEALLLPAEPGRSAEPVDAGMALMSSGSLTRTRFLGTMNVISERPAPTARTRFEMGRRYWRRVDFVEAAHAAAATNSPASRLLLALSLALAKGPQSAQEMMGASSPAALGLNHTDALDALVKEGGSLAGMAAFDAAHLRSLCPPDGEAAGTYLADIAARFRKAASLLEDPAHKKRAEERAADTDAAAKSAGAKPAGS